MRKYISFLLFLIFIVGSFLYGRSFRVNQIPNGTVNTCANCHVNPQGGGERNAFGKLVEARFLSQPGAAGNVLWTPLLASYDADMDGVTNGEELQDPFGMWQSGQPAPGNGSFVTLPGINSSNNFSTLTLQISGMDPHLGENLFIRVIDKANMKESGRTVFSSIVSSFDVMIDAILPGHSYFVDMFADHNNNGLYDAPPIDHAWRIEVDNVQGNESAAFSHNTNFSDIDWDYVLTLNFSGMDPHIGQLLELRAEDDLTSDEVGRTRIETISNGTFSLEIIGLKLSKEYKVDFYADLNGNGIYDAPPTDHAWSLDFTNTTGDVTQNFTHNTSFTDIGWKYLMKINLMDMTPHIGQLFELRVVDQNNSQEIGRQSISGILVPDFTIEIPQIEIGHDYNIDFYADLNGSGMYNAPPVDHAWRIPFTSSAGDHIENFTHNTSFTDIQWPTATAVEDELTQPANYVLYQNYPNPFNPETNIKFNLSDRGFVSLKIFDILGREVAVLVNEAMEPGIHEFNFNAGQLNSGVYLYRLTTENFTETKRMVLLK